MNPRNAPSQSNGFKVGAMMTDAVITVSQSASVGEANKLMLQHNIRQLPVVEGRDLMGVVTDRDIRSVTSDRMLIDPAEMTRALNTPIRDVMTREPVTLSPDDDLPTALALFIEKKFGGIPVVDKSAGLLGIVTYIDLLRCFLNRLMED